MAAELDFNDPEPLVATLAQLFLNRGQAREVAVLAYAVPQIVQTGYDNWNGGTYEFELHLRLPHALYSQVEGEIEAIEQVIADQAWPLLRAHQKEHLTRVVITPSLSVGEGWRGDARAWLAGSGVTNQGRVRSNNIAAREADGLLFRSQPEINLYRALKAAGVSFAPLPVFLRGGAEYRRIEPDFVIVKDGIMLVVEVDGDTVHHETPAEAHARTTMLQHEGAYIERVRAKECETADAAVECARRLLQVLVKLKAAK